MAGRRMPVSPTHRLPHAWVIACLWALLAAGCSGLPTAPSPRTYLTVPERGKAHDVVLYALGLLDTGYRYGGANPDAGLDCSGMVSHIYGQVTGVYLPHNAAQIAHLTRPVARSELQPGDLVFFNTQHRPYSHVGIYIGDNRFVHAPSTARGKIQITPLDSRYFSSRYDGARTLFADGAPDPAEHALP